MDRPEFERVHEALDDEADLIGEQVYALGRAVERALRRHGKKIIERQYVQERLANAAMELFLATATLSRATAESDLNLRPCQSKPSLSTVTVCSTPSHSRSSFVPVTGLRGSSSILMQQKPPRASSAGSLIRVGSSAFG